MKKLALICAIMMMATMAMAQRKVAILETVDKSDNVSYGVKLLLRSSLTTAISNTPGYEGFDRVDMAQIAGEQDFQRTGNVSDSQIKQLGMATGASYVLVAEAAYYDDSRRSIIITAKILDVETFGISSSAVLVSGINSDEVQKSCNTLATRLLKTEPKPKKTEEQSTPAPTVMVQPTVAPTIAPTLMSDTKKQRRSPWFGIGASYGIYEYYDHDYYEGATYNVDFDMAFSITNTTAIGLYTSVGSADGDLLLLAGIPLKMSFGNHFGLLFSAAGGIVDFDSDALLFQVRTGIEIGMFHLTLSAMWGTDADYYDEGYSIGIGINFGGKLQK